ncbi:MAG: M48 family metallopeptidase [Synechococcus sp. SB0676_bin_10]|uniref:M48 family metallopeptidase n=1 Tax=Synechococcus sp. SB0676_bin_10 TaxID=2604869 RepID=A0A6B1F3Z1_9SYNE|nr:M48 family metallopeptidase [Synechococcus sp. SB0676_bin_10]
MTDVPPEILGLRVKVIRSTRRTAALHIIGNELHVRIPERLGDERVAGILQQKRPWIRAKAAEWQAVPPRRPRAPVSGELANSLPYLGRNYRLKVREGITSGRPPVRGISHGNGASRGAEGAAAAENPAVPTTMVSLQGVGTPAGKDQPPCPTDRGDANGRQCSQLQIALGILQHDRASGVQLDHHQGAPCHCQLRGDP